MELPEEENTPEKRVDRIFAMMDKVRMLEGVFPVAKGFRRCCGSLCCILALAGASFPHQHKVSAAAKIAMGHPHPSGIPGSISGSPRQHCPLHGRHGWLDGESEAEAVEWGGCVGWCGCAGVPGGSRVEQCSNRSVLQNADGKLTLQEFQEGSKADPSIVQALSLYDGLV